MSYSSPRNIYSDLTTSIQKAAPILPTIENSIRAGYKSTSFGGHTLCVISPENNKIHIYKLEQNILQRIIEQIVFFAKRLFCVNKSSSYFGKLTYEDTIEGAKGQEFKPETFSKLKEKKWDVFTGDTLKAALLEAQVGAQARVVINEPVNIEGVNLLKSLEESGNQLKLVEPIEVLRDPLAAPLDVSLAAPLAEPLVDDVILVKSSENKEDQSLLEFGTPPSRDEVSSENDEPPEDEHKDSKLSNQLVPDSPAAALPSSSAPLPDIATSPTEAPSTELMYYLLLSSIAANTSPSDLPQPQVPASPMEEPELILASTPALPQTDSSSVNLARTALKISGTAESALNHAASSQIPKAVEAAINECDKAVNAYKARVTELKENFGESCGIDSIYNLQMQLFDCTKWGCEPGGWMNKPLNQLTPLGTTCHIEKIEAIRLEIERKINELNEIETSYDQIKQELETRSKHFINLRQSICDIENQYHIQLCFNKNSEIIVVSIESQNAWGARFARSLNLIGSNKVTDKLSSIIKSIDGVSLDVKRFNQSNLEQFRNKVDSIHQKANPLFKEVNCLVEEVATTSVKIDGVNQQITVLMDNLERNFQFTLITALKRELKEINNRSTPYALQNLEQSITVTLHGLHTELEQLLTSYKDRPHTNGCDELRFLQNLAIQEPSTERTEQFNQTKQQLLESLKSQHTDFMNLLASTENDPKLNDFPDKRSFIDFIKKTRKNLADLARPHFSDAPSFPPRSSEAFFQFFSIYTAALNSCLADFNEREKELLLFHDTKKAIETLSELIPPSEDDDEGPSRHTQPMEYLSFIESLYQSTSSSGLVLSKEEISTHLQQLKARLDTDIKALISQGTKSYLNQLTGASPQISLQGPQTRIYRSDADFENKRSTPTAIPSSVRQSAAAAAPISPVLRQQLSLATNQLSPAKPASSLANPTQIFLRDIQETCDNLWLSLPEEFVNTLNTNDPSLDFVKSAHMNAFLKALKAFQGAYLEKSQNKKAVNAKEKISEQSRAKVNLQVIKAAISFMDNPLLMEKYTPLINQATNRIIGTVPDTWTNLESNPFIPYGEITKQFTAKITELEKFYTMIVEGKQRGEGIDRQNLSINSKRYLSIALDEINKLIELNQLLLEDSDFDTLVEIYAKLYRAGSSLITHLVLVLRDPSIPQRERRVPTLIDLI